MGCPIEGTFLLCFCRVRPLFFGVGGVCTLSYLKGVRSSVQFGAPKMDQLYICFQEG
jgi:hypothetical protein